MNTSTTNGHTEGTASSIKTLLQELRAEGTQLFRQEAELAKTELSEKATSLANHGAQIGIGGAVAYAGLVVALFGLGDLVAGLLLEAGLAPTTALWVGRLSVGLVVALIGWAMFAKAKRAMKNDTLVPEQTLQTLRENKQWMQNKLQHSHEPI